MLIAALVLAVIGLVLIVLVSHLVGIVVLVVAACFLLLSLLGGGLPNWPVR